MAEWRLPYEKIRCGLRPGDVLAFQGTGPISKGIAIYEYFKTKTPVSECITHVSGVVSGPAVLTRKLMIEADEGEVNPRAISTEVEQYNGKIYWYPLREELAMFRNAMDLLYWNSIGKKYDYGLYRNFLFLGNGKVDKERYVCSELVQCTFQIIPIVIILEILRNMNKKEEDFPILSCLSGGKVMRPHQIVQLPFFKPRIEISR
ncbi:MAG: hypothetical protein SVK08_01390 [Halobacteriota archaeon]|nr:hypothetical protein [Halobacteriota archaeon]